jgi:hypothetical protein
MAIKIEDALKFIRPHLSEVKKLRDYAVSDFLGYISIVQDYADLEEGQKTWALYLKWKDLVASDSGKYSSSNGTSFKPEIPFVYKNGKDKEEAPTIVPGVKTLKEYVAQKKGSVKEAELKKDGYREATLRGVGQCEYFAQQAYGHLKVPAKSGTTAPLIKKIATPGHNWVIVNYDDESAKKPELWVIVDFWLAALGLSADKYVCAYNKRAVKFKEDIEVVFTYDPNTQTEVDEKKKKKK